MDKCGFGCTFRFLHHLFYAGHIKGYVGDYYEIEENAERIYIGNELPEEYTESESRKSLMGANAKAKVNAATAIPELIQIE